MTWKSHGLKKVGQKLQHFMISLESLEIQYVVTMSGNLANANCRQKNGYGKSRDRHKQVMKRKSVRLLGEFVSLDSINLCGKKHRLCKRNNYICFTLPPQSIV